MEKRYLGERNDTTIRRKKDIDTVCGIANENWKMFILDIRQSAAAKFRWMCSKDTPIKGRFCRPRRLSEYVWEEETECRQCCLLEIRQMRIWQGHLKSGVFMLLPNFKGKEWENADGFCRAKGEKNKGIKRL